MAFLQKYIYIGKRWNLNWIQAHVSFILSTFSVPTFNSTKQWSALLTYNVQRIFAKIHLRLYPINMLQCERDRRALIEKKRRGAPPCTTFMDSKRLRKNETRFSFTNLLSPALYTVRISLLVVWKCPTSISYSIFSPHGSTSPSGPVHPHIPGFTITLETRHNR